MKTWYFSRHPRALLAGALTIGLAGIGFGAAEHLHNANPPVVLKVATDGPSHSGFGPVVKKVVPAVVNIASTKVSKTPTGYDGGGSLQDDPLFRQFFGDSGNRRFNSPREAPEHREQGLGSGVIMSPDGYIVTNNHVVDGATDIRVNLADKREFKAKVIGTDPKSDIAVLKIDATDLPSITVADSSQVQVGDYALAVGNPFGVGKTVTMGIVSATSRSHLGIEDYEDFIQTDAPINPGNSGGALVNDRGQLIGINTAILSHGSSGNQGIGFAIPVNQVRNVMDQLVKTGKVTRAYMGIVPQDVTPSIASAFGRKDSNGALVGDVSANSPALKSGVQKGDIILEVDGKPVADANSLRMAISMMQPDAKVNLRIWRDGAQREVSMQLGELPTEMASAKLENSGEKSSLSGVAVQNLDAETAQDLKLPANSHGVVVTKVSPSSEAAQAGLRRGDVIQEVNHKPVKSTNDFEQAVNGSKDNTLLLVNRNGSTMYLAV